MKVFKKIIGILVIVSFSSLTSGCATYKFGRLPSPYIIDYPNSATQKDVSVAVKFLNPIEALSVFDCEMDKRDMAPVFIVIENKGQDSYSFKKADVDSSYLSGEEAAKKCSRSTMGRVVTYGALGLFVIAWVVFIPMAIAEMINCPKINAQMKTDYCTNEIPDTTVGPGRSLSGVMFVTPFKSADPFVIPLVNCQSGQKLLFKFKHDQSIPSETLVSQNKKDEKVTTPKGTIEPKQNFGPK